MQLRDKKHKQGRTIQEIPEHNGNNEKKLDLFWRHSNCGVAIKIHTADAILRSKLLYGTESAQLLPSVLKRIETFQLKVLRKILRMDTTYINRENTNSKVFEEANNRSNEERKRKR